MNDPELSNRHLNIVLPDSEPKPSRWWWNERREARASNLPGLAIQVHVAPWHWRVVPWWFRDDLEPTYWIVAWLFLEIELFWPRRTR